MIGVILLFIALTTVVFPIIVFGLELVIAVLALGHAQIRPGESLPARS